MRGSDRPDGAEERLSPEARRRVMRAALLRPMHLLVVVVGAVFFALTFEWWIVPLTIATYAALIFLAPRDQVLRNRLLEGREDRPGTRSGTLEGSVGKRDVSLEQRAHRLRRGETRRKVEAALEVYRRTVFAIEESDDVAKVLLSDAVPKLHGVAERLVGVAEKREKAAGEFRDPETPADAKHREGRNASFEELEKELRTADAEISDAFEKFSTLRARVVRVSTESGGAAQDAAAKLNADLDELSLRLDALSSTMSNSELPDR